MVFPYPDLFEALAHFAAFFDTRNDKQFRCFFLSAYDMIPDRDPQKHILYEAIQTYPLNDLRSPVILLEWVFKIVGYFHYQTTNVKFMSFDRFREKYKSENITIDSWSHPVWRILHEYAAGYDRTQTYALSYKSMVSCLVALLPCARCRNHLKDNLADHPIDNFFGSREDLFTWSYILHQKVSSQLKKKGISFDEAKKIYLWQK